MDKTIYEEGYKFSMTVTETQDEFIFSTLNNYAQEHFDMTVDKKELTMAIQLVRMYRERGQGIGEVWNTAVRNKAELDKAYHEGYELGRSDAYERMRESIDEQNNRNV